MSERMEHVEIPSAGETLRGMIHYPEAPSYPAPFPAVVLSHGFTGNRVEAHGLFVRAARAFTARGMAAVRFDFRGSGESDGEFHFMTVSREVEDLLSILAWLDGRKELNPSRTALLGFSLGGLVATLAASRWKRAKGLCLWSPLADLSGWIRTKVDLAAVERLPPDGYVELWGNRVGKQFITEAAAFPPIHDIALSPLSTLVVHGTGDSVVPLTDGELYARTFRADLRPIDGANHTYDLERWQMELLRTTADWLVRVL
jgi:uncharacterized protein